MIKSINHLLHRSAMKKKEYRKWREEYRIKKIQPVHPRAKLLLCAMGPSGPKVRGKGTVEKFFPPFCHVLAHCGISTKYVFDLESLQNELLLSKKVPTIILDIYNEDFDDIDSCCDFEDGLGLVPVVFNSRRIARIVRDKQFTNQYLSKRGVLMPKLDVGHSQKIFSNSRFGSKESVYLAGNTDNLDENRYNTEFVDTTVEFRGEYYYTCVRLMCIGPHITQAYVRAAPVSEGNLSARDVTTPIKPDLIHYFYKKQVHERFSEHLLLAKNIEAALGPGFYAHDVLIDANSNSIYLAEVGFKFYQPTYYERFFGHVQGKKFRSSVIDQETYARYAACFFVTYCSEMNFI